MAVFGIAVEHGTWAAGVTRASAIVVLGAVIAALVSITPTASGRGRPAISGTGVSVGFSQTVWVVDSAVIGTVVRRDLGVIGLTVRLAYPTTPMGVTPKISALVFRPAPVFTGQVVVRVTVTAGKRIVGPMSRLIGARSSSVPERQISVDVGPTGLVTGKETASGAVKSTAMAFIAIHGPVRLVGGTAFGAATVFRHRRPARAGLVI